MPKTERLPEIIVFAGPNGSGKSTVTRIAKVVQPYINADDIKTALNCSDLEAAQVAEKMRNAQVDAGEGFTFETVLSTSRNLELLKRAKAKGFFIRCIYVLTASPDINVIRVKAREAAGGHGVPEDIIASQLLLLSIIVLARIFSKKQEGGLSFEWLLPLFPCQILSVFVCYIVLCKTVQNSFDPFLILVLLTLLCINITIVFYSEAMRSSESRRRNSELAEQQYTMQKEYYQRLHENQEETRALWHDIKKYVLAMQAFADKKDQQQLQQIVQQANDTLDSISTVVDIDNIVISSILDSYARSAKESDIDFHLDVMVPPTLPISPVDLYIILGNTLDNAIEACIALPKEKRYINILLRKENGILFYRIQNSYNGEKEKIHLHGKFHGYGLSNVRKCVSKYGGSVTPVQGTDSYMIEMYLNCK